jgi:beta-glucanase (GH16 family)
MGIRRVRSVALVISTVLAASTAAVTSAEAAVRRAPTASVSQVDATTVVVSGRTATRHPRVRVERRTPSGWALVTKVRARKHHYRAALSLAAGSSQRFRVTSDKRSRAFVVTMSSRTASPAKKPAPPTQYDDCGARPAKADGTLWSCTFDDEFSGTTLDRTKWLPNTAFVTGSQSAYTCYRDDPANVNVDGGALNLTMVKLDAPASCALAVAPTQYMSGSVTTSRLFSQQYGRFEARMKTPAVSSPGLHEAFWLWPDDRYSTINWPASGEIDIAETFSAYPSIAGSYLHYDSPQSSLLLSSNAKNCAAQRGVWNTYTLEWGPSRIETFVNGKSCLVNTSGDPAFQKRYVINLTEAMGGATWNQLTDPSVLPATLQFDYVRVWK